MNAFRRSLMGCIALLAVCGFTAISNVASAQLTGTQVTGSLQFSTGGPNYFDTGNGFVPASGYGNSGLPAGNTTVTIGAPAGTQTFGFMDGANTDSANFTNTQLVVTDVVTNSTNNNPITMTFTDPIFDDITKVSDTFPQQFAYSITGDTITVDNAGGAVTTGSTYQAVFNISTVGAAVPEPGVVALLATSGLSGAGLLLRGRRARK